MPLDAAAIIAPPAPAALVSDADMTTFEPAVGFAAAIIAPPSVVTGVTGVPAAPLASAVAAALTAAMPDDPLPAPADLAPGDNRSTSFCSMPPVATVDTLASTPVSKPNAIATTPASIAAPIPRRIHSPAP